MNKSFTCVLLMLTVAPIVTCTAFLYLAYYLDGGDRPDLFMIMTAAIFGVITVPLWPTYIPSIVVAPIVMKKVSMKEKFWSMPTSQLIALSLIAGSLLGMFVMLPAILIALTDHAKWAIIWALSGASSGSVTLCLIILIYRTRS